MWLATRYLLGAFTVCESYTIAVVCAMYYENGAGMIVLQALILTAAVFISLTVYALKSKKVSQLRRKLIFW